MSDLQIGKRYIFTTAHSRFEGEVGEICADSDWLVVKLSKVERALLRYSELLVISEVE